MADQRPIGFWLKLLDGLFDEQFAVTLDEHGVTRRQWQLLNVLSRGDATIEQLNAAVAPFLAGEDDESASDHLAELVESTWVDVTAGGYQLTERGRGALERLSAVVSDQRTMVAAGLSEDEYLTTVATLERMARNLGWSDPPVAD
jgi:DNA-binding MarR family transcriptional regulator